MTINRFQSKVTVVKDTCLVQSRGGSLRLPMTIILVDLGIYNLSNDWRSVGDSAEKNY
jgi:hypothetical protein